jgi:hypothetical protein
MTLFKGEEFFEFLHVKLFVDDYYSLYMPIDGSFKDGSLL